MVNPSKNNGSSPNPTPGRDLRDSLDFASPQSLKRQSTDPLISSLDKRHHPLQDRRVRTGIELPKDHSHNTAQSGVKKLWHRWSKSAHAKAGSSEPLQGPQRQTTSLTDHSVTFEQTKPWDQKAILSLDGGGIRGYSALLIVQDLMRKIQEIEESQPEGNNEWEGPASSSYYPVDPLQVMSTDSNSKSNVSDDCSKATESSHFLPCHYFDYMAGTSTGGLISIMLGRLRMNVDDCIEEYRTLGKKVFGRSRLFHLRSIPPFWFPREKYNHKTLEGVIQGLIDRRIPKIGGFPGGKTFAFDENRCRVVVVAFQEKPERDSEPQLPYLFRTYKNLKTAPNSMVRNPGPAHDIPILEVARATSAAPAYFKEVTIDHRKYLDGGFGANNPCLEIFREVRSLNNYNNTCLGSVISIGTGKNNESRMTSENGFKQNISMGLAKFIHYENFARKWASESEGTHRNMLDHHISPEQSFEYARLNVEEGLACMKLDEWKCRGPMRIALGRCIGWARFKMSQRKASKSPGNDHNEKGRALDDDNASDSLHSASSHSKDDAAQCPHRDALDRYVPRCLEPRIKTLDTIRTQTEKYLDNPERQAELLKIAKYLVENRRARVKADSVRWRKACYGTWYQCQVQGCQRGQQEYPDETAMKNHLRHKHSVLFKDDTDHSKLEKMVGDFRVTVH